MEAGRELDALVAEKVMGLMRHNESYMAEGVGKVLRFVWRDRGGACIYSGDMFLPHYSTNIADAWEVVNHLLCHGWDEKYFFRLEYDAVDLWDASFYKESSSDGGGPEVWGNASDPALAICLAALKAVNQEAMMSMDMKAAQAKISAAIIANADEVIAKAILWNPATAEIVAEVRKAPGTVQGVAAAALKDALRGKDNAETVSNMIAFAEHL